MATAHDELGARLRTALELADLGIEMYEAKVRREHPELSEAEVQQSVSEWLHTRPGAESGDAEGRRVAWPRRK